MAYTKADTVADFILCYFHERGIPITHLKLQKLVYYVQVWFLAIYGEPLFEEPFEAWIHGPVQPGVYRRFKSYLGEPITEGPVRPDFPDAIRAHIDEVMAVYGRYSAERLESIVHRERPWNLARRGLMPRDRSNEKIDEKDMMAFYREIGRK